jgi:hypothetical protein
LEIAMADACLLHDDRLIEAAHGCPADVAAAQALVTSSSSTTACVGADRAGVGSGAGV